MASRACAVALLTLSFACGDDPVAPAAGSLPVAIQGLPPGIAGAVAVVGEGAQTQLTESREIPDLRPGEYAVTAAEVTTAGTRYGAIIDRPTVTVPPGGRAPVVRVFYAPASGRMRIVTMGRPPGAPANISVTRASGGSAVDVDSTATLDGLAPGAYTIIASDLVAGGVTYRADPASQTVELGIGVVPVPVEVTYGVGTGQLDVGVTGLADGVGAAVVVSGPAGYTRTVRGSGSLRHLQAGTYTVTPVTVGADLVTYLAGPAQDVTVSGGATAAVSVAYSATPLSVRLQLAAEGLTAPVFLTAPEGDARQFVVERNGRVRVIENGVLLPTAFLDITTRVNFTGERGMLGLAFDPTYATTGRFFVYYVTPSGAVALERFSSTPGANVAGQSDGVVLTIPHGGSEHHGGTIAFGPDHMLYLGPGDGRCCGDPDQNAQNLSSRLGKILRIDARQLPYAIPIDNPFAAEAGAAPEIWASGLRNPWRFSFDRESRLLIIGDVGQDAREEIDAALSTQGGLNYGWPRMEGTACYSPSSNCQGSLPLTPPVLEYLHAEGCSVIGGYVYRGEAIPELRGRYLYTDFCAGWLRSAKLQSSGASEHRTWSGVSAPFTASMGQDGRGELYMIGQGKVWRIVRG